MTFTRWTGQRCYSWSFTAGIMRSADTLNFYLDSMCMHPLQFVCVIFLPADFICSFLHWVYEVNLSFRVPHNCELRSDKFSWCGVPVRLWGREMRHPFVYSSLSQPVIPIILFNFGALAYLSISKPSQNACVCFADLRLWHEGRGLRLHAVPTGEVLQREVRNLSTAQRLQRPLQVHCPCSGNPGERRWVWTLFTWVSIAE